MTPLDNLLNRLDGVKQVGHDRWMALTPSRKEKTASLSVRLTGEGKILLHDFGGDSAEDVLDAISLTFSDLYPDDPNRATYAAATANGGRKFQNRLLRDSSVLDEDRVVVRLAQRWLQEGRVLSLDDQARLDLALSRLEEVVVVNG
ncbi:MAG: hypothetical protein RPU59_07745 [Candidatus Sedimenticola sp. (ex Thyasira tokunagai)]